MLKLLMMSFHRMIKADNRLPTLRRLQGDLDFLSGSFQVNVRVRVCKNDVFTLNN